jgi:hypothetical protein
MEYLTSIQINDFQTIPWGCLETLVYRAIIQGDIPKKANWNKEIYFLKDTFNYKKVYQWSSLSIFTDPFILK